MTPFTFPSPRPFSLSARAFRQGICALLTALAVHLHSATYFIDYAGGNDEADGLSPQTAWKHSPGDRNAAGQPAAAQLQPGDVLRFKGGVRYFGELQLNFSGDEGAPIVLDGNLDGNYGEGRAILDGARVISGWQKLTSAEQAQGNPRWREMVSVDLDVDLTSNFSQNGFVGHRDAGVTRQAPWQSLFLIDGEKRVLPVAQRPKPSDPFYPDIPSDFYNSEHPLTHNYPHKVFYEEGTIGNRTAPVISITFGGGNAPVIQPFNGGAVSVEMAEAATIAEMGFTLFRPASTPVPEHIAFFVDGKEVIKATVDPKDTKMQRFALPEALAGRKLTFQLLHSGADLPTWTKLQQIAAFTPEGVNVIQHEIASVIRDEERLTQPEADWFDGMFVGVHGGNNHVYFARVQKYDPQTNSLHVPHFQPSTYDTTRYAFYNTPRLIDLPGEWCVVPLEGGRTRVFLLPEHPANGLPGNIGYPELKTAISIERAASHLDIRGFLIQRYAGGSGGITTRGRGADRPSHIRIADCEIRFLSGNSGIGLHFTDHVTVENCFIHQCPGWTVGIYVNRTNHFQLIGNRLDNNSGSGIRHYEAKNGVLRGNAVLNHYGMHSSGLNFYEGCVDIVFEDNYIQNVIAINRSAENLLFRNNVIDSQHRGTVGIALWTSGRVGGRFLKNLQFINNTIVNPNPDVAWASGLLVQRRNSPSSPEGLVIRNNIVSGLAEDVVGVFENNLYTHPVEERFLGNGNQLVEDPSVLFLDASKGDFRRKPGGPNMEAGANLAFPPPR